MNPAGDGSVVNLNPSLRHHFLEIAQAQGVGQIPTNTLGHDIDRIMEAFKRVSDQGHRSGLAQKQGSLPDDRLMRQNPNAPVQYTITIFYQVIKIIH
ncbi:hypothetical protein [Xenorhabdus bovienii]|uniref:hypothetical protein n=1 Tax=Xenorhabdus bovienii TaxID=40576 RepID=UPI0023B30621|nr:hypothetical protein [Xenorhabdus bovienii]